MFSFRRAWSLFLPLVADGQSLLQYWSDLKKWDACGGSCGPNPSGLGNVQVTSLAKEREERVAAAKPRPMRSGQPNGIALCFMTIRGITTGTFWERWFRDADVYIKSELRQNPRDVLRGFVGWSPAFELDKVREFLPPSLKEATIKQPVPCTWATSALCEAQIFREAFQSWRNAGYFILISSNSIPVKSFKAIYQDILADTRIRASVISWDFSWMHLIKSANWRALSRRQMKILLSDPEYPDKLEAKWSSSGDFCGTDECDIWKPHLKALKERFFDDILYIPWQGSVRYPLECRFFFDCWPNTEGCPTKGIKSTEPAYFTHMPMHFVDLLLQHPHIWMFRKVDDDAWLADGAYTIADFVGLRTGSKFLNITLPPHPYQDSIPIARDSQATFANQVQLMKAHRVYGLRPDV